MNVKRILFLIVAILIFGVAMVFIFGLRFPPEKLKASDLSAIKKVVVDNHESYTFSEEEIAYWESLTFTIVQDNYPGATPDFVTSIVSEQHNFSAIFNKNSNTIFLCFVPEIRYGFLNSRPAGGWQKPLYKVEANEQLLKLLRLDNYD